MPISTVQECHEEIRREESIASNKAARSQGMGTARDLYDLKVIMDLSSFAPPSLNPSGPNYTM
ncbi:uncharacterized protein RSE6_10525 [Rhynchosporium secalis]|uniref:Uncharacterized protein n=1 Tax=Rhynchosporium secalis TaxID=38038 RepID=A0A1E1MKP7_RHYSE|nr:uncharacterized protein RSE6_10525 [Rhynchosporium secalis]